MKGLLTLCAVVLTLMPGPTSAQTKDKPLKVGGSIHAPKQLKYVKPGLTEENKDTKGSVVLELTLDDAGNVDSVKVIKPLAPVTDAAVKAAKQWKYAETVVDGKKVWLQMTVVVPFPSASETRPAAGNAQKLQR